MSKKIFGLGFSHFQGKQSSFNDLIRTGIDNGITYLEACSFYNNYKCEENLKIGFDSIIDRNQILLGNKLCYKTCQKLYNGNLELYFNNQLKNCNTSYFDYYLIQYVDQLYFNEKTKTPNSLFIEQYNFLLTKKREGKIKNIGFVFHYFPEYFEECFQIFQWDCVQFSLNYYKWSFGYAKDLYKIATKYSIPIIAMEPLAMGFLSTPTLIREAAYHFLLSLSNVKIILNGATQPQHIYHDLVTLQNFSSFTIDELNELKKYCSRKYFCICEDCLIKCPRQYDLKNLVNHLNLRDKNKDNKIKYYNFFEPFLVNRDICYKCKICQDNCKANFDFQNIIWKEIFPLRI